MGGETGGLSGVLHGLGGQVPRHCKPDDGDDGGGEGQAKKGDPEPVSYTHLTLPTICSV